MFYNIIGRNYEPQGFFEEAELAYLHSHYMVPSRIYPLYLLMNMKMKSLIIAASTVAVFASCAQVSDVTEITGTVVPEGFDAVQVTVGEQLDTLVPIVDGKFSITVPTDVCQTGTLAAGQYGINFIPDGTPLQVVLKDTSTVTSMPPI